MKLFAKELEIFYEEGWAGTYNLLSAEEAANITSDYLKRKSNFLYPSDITCLREKSPEKINETPWFKSLHAYIPSLFQLVCNDVIVAKVKSILGENVIAWGCCIVERKPKQIHRWHIDVEHQKWNGVSVFVGLNGISMNSSLTILTKSHKFNSAPQSFSFETTGDLIDYCTVKNPQSKILNVGLSIGDFFIFHGLLWHSSNNQTDNNRYALLIQYSTPDSEIDIPINWDPPVQWANVRPPCILVSGKDNYLINYIIPSPLS